MVSQLVKPRQVGYPSKQGSAPMSDADRQSQVVRKKGWTKPRLKLITAGSAEADLNQDVKDGANVSAKS